MKLVLRKALASFVCRCHLVWEFNVMTFLLQLLSKYLLRSL